MKLNSQLAQIRAFYFIVLFTFLFLNACSSARHESRPVYPPPEIYRGSQYMVASWYGPNFHGRPTSSGEIFDMYAHTAAHKTLSFGTKLMITNPENGKSTYVTINDRGPFIPGRDVDLSYQAAKEIGLIGPGTGTVKVDFIERDESYIKYVKISHMDRGPYTIQIGSFVQHINAIRLKKALEFSYKDIYIINAHINGEPMFRVRIGKYHDKKNAAEMAEILADEGYNVLLMHHDKQI